MGLVESAQNGLCRRRNATNDLAAPKADGPTGKVVRSVARSKAEKPLQKNSAAAWQKLLQDIPLNPDAAKFQPSGLKLPPGLPEPDMARRCMQADDDEPEWLQYLSKKVVERQSPPSIEKSASNKRVTQTDPGAFSGQSRVLLAEREGLRFQTSDYLKILKDTPKNKTSGPSKRKKLGPLNSCATSPLAQIASVEIPGGASVGPEQWTAEWRAEVTRTLLSPGNGEDDMAIRFSQDDTFFEKLNKDEDLSDPGYLSEVETCSFKGPSKKGASFHALGRRPRQTDTSIRSYVMQDLNHHLDGLVAMTLLRLQRFSDEGKSLLQAKAPRRFIIGLREVARRMKQGKLACIIVAPDIEEDQENGGLDDRMRELLASAYRSGTPVIFALSRARIGCALGKTVQVSVFAIKDATGAMGLLGESLQLAAQLRQSWLSGLEKKPANPSSFRQALSSAIIDKVPTPAAAASPWRRAATGAALGL